MRDYDTHHRKRGNKICHFIGIPSIVISLFGLLHAIPGPVSPAALLWIIGCVFYVTLHLQLGVTMVFTTGAAFLLGTRLSIGMDWFVFIAGWVFQGIGHYVYEKKSPAFADNFIHLLIGPAYLQNLVLKIVKY